MDNVCALRMFAYNLIYHSKVVGVADERLGEEVCAWIKYDSLIYQFSEILYYLNPTR